VLRPPPEFATHTIQDGLAPPRAIERSQDTATYRSTPQSCNIIGYARVSTREPSTEAQEAELTAYGAVRVFT